MDDFMRLVELIWPLCYENASNRVTYGPAPAGELGREAAEYACGAAKVFIEEARRGRRRK